MTADNRLLTRHGLTLVAALLALVLIGTSALRFAGARRAAAVVAMMEGDRLGERLRRELAGRPASQHQAVLERVISREPGLTYAAVMRPDRQLVVEVGPPPPSGAPAPPGMPRFVQDTVVVDVGVHPPGAPRPPPGAPPPVRLGFDPGEARPVRLAGAWDLAIGVVSALGLLALAALVWALDRRRERAEVAANEQAHLASLGEMSAVLAHEIRNPLAALKGHAQLLEERLRGDGGHASAERVVNGAVRLEHLIEDLLRFAQSGELQREQVDPIAVAHDALTRVAPDRIELFADEAPERWSMDRERIGRVLDNLLRNAVQASGDEAMVDLHVRLRGNRLCYIVRDRGPGISEAVRDRLFEPFVTTRTRGTGLGLAVSQRLVVAHGGTLTVDAAPEGGARFTVSLPR